MSLYLSCHLRVRETSSGYSSESPLPVPKDLAQFVSASLDAIQQSGWVPYITMWVLGAPPWLGHPPNVACARRVRAAGVSDNHCAKRTKEIVTREKITGGNQEAPRPPAYTRVMCTHAHTHTHTHTHTHAYTHTRIHTHTHTHTHTQTRTQTCTHTDVHLFKCHFPIAIQLNRCSRSVAGHLYSPPEISGWVMHYW